MTDQQIEHRTLTFADIAAVAGHLPAPDGRLNLPADQATADALAAAARQLALGGKAEWEPGDPAIDVTLTGAGPVWGYLAIAHGLHGVARRLTYAAPNAQIEIYAHCGPAD